MEQVQLRLLGPVEIVDAAGRAVPVGGPKERALLALLGIHANEAVSEDRIVDALWGDDPPRTASKTIQAYVSRLRRALADAAPDDDSLVIETRPPGYRLRVGPGALDVVEVEELVAQAQAATVGGDHGWASVALSRAWRAWRGASLGEFADAPFASATAIRLEELRQVALEERIDAELASGRHAPLVGELEALCAAHPLREPLWAQRMVALYRSGRQAEALRVFQDLRHHLGEELGIEPGPNVVALEHALLDHDPSLDWTPTAVLPTATGASLPTGVVTFLLTDIVGSSQLWDDHPVAMPVALERHDRVVADTVAAGGGYTIKSKGEGDSTLSVFGRATDAASTALDLHAALAAEAWPDGIDLRARIALHTGEANERGGDYYGATVNRAARLRALAMGGQVVMSEVTAGLVRDHLPSGCDLVDRGRHELRGLARDEQVFELTRDGGVAAPAPVSEPDQPTNLAVALPTALRPAASVGFVGRAREVERLTAQLDEAATGARQAVLIAGEPGIGKTRLAAEIARAAHERGAIVLFGRCDEDLGVPYQPFAEALAHFVAHLPRASGDLLGTLPGELVHLMPQLGQHVAGLPPSFSADAETERQRLFDAVASWLGSAAAQAPVVVVLDDLHWATKATLLLLRHVLRATPGVALYIVGTYRDTELGRTHPLADALADLRRESNVERVLLQGLDTDGATSFVEAAARRELEPAERQLAEAMRVETNGNPFFMGEVMRHLVDTGAVARNDGQWVLSVDAVADAGLPEGVREVISRRVSRLSNAANRALSVAAVVGPTFDRQLLEQIPDAGADPDSLLDALDEAVRAGILTESGRGYTFAHALIRQTLYNELTSARRTRLHCRVGESIEALPDPDARIESLAHHFFEAALDGQAAKAVDYCRRAGDQALARLAYDEAADLFGRALEASEINAPVLSDDDRDELLVGRCEALLASGDVASASGAIADLQASTKGSPRLGAWAACFAGQLAVLTHPERLDEIERAVATAAEQLAGLDDAAGEAKAHTVRAACLARLGRIADCETALDRALTAARRGGEHRRVNAVLAGEPLAALWGPNPVPRAGGRCLDVIRLLRITTGSPAVEATSKRCQAVLEAFRGRPDAARHMIDLARSTLGDLGLRHALYEVDLYAGIVELVTDEPADAEPHLRRAYSGFRSMGVDVDAAQAAAHLARACVAIGRDEEAAELCAESERLGGHDLQASIAWRAVRAQLLARAGDHDAARELADAAVAIAERTDALVDHGDACLALATVLLAAGDEAGARAASDRAAALYERKGAAALVARAKALVGRDRQRPASLVDVRTTTSMTLENQASRAWTQFAEHFEAHDTAAVASFFSSELRTVDRRRGVGNLTDQVDWLENINVLWASGFTAITATVVATRGDRLALVYAAVTAGDFEMAGPMLVGVDASGRPDLFFAFETEDTDAAFAELDACYLEGEGAPHAATLRVLAQAMEAYNARDDLAEVIHDHLAIVDHRVTPSAVADGRAGMLPLIWGELADVPDLTMRATAVHEIDDLGAVATVLRNGHTPDGAALEQQFHVVVMIDDGRVVRMEGYLETQLDAALERFAALRAPAPSNAASAAIDRARVAWNDGASPDELLATVSAGVTIEDRRRGLRDSSAGASSATQQWRALRDIGTNLLDTECVAIRGERLAALRGTFKGRREHGFEALVHFVVEVDDTGRVVGFVMFDPDDLDAALAELDARYAAQIAPTAGPQPNKASELINRNREMFLGGEALNIATPDYRWDDHRTGIRTELLGPSGIESLVDAMRGISTSAVDGELLATAGDCLAMHRCRFGGASGFHVDMLLVQEVDADGRLLVRSASFDPDDMVGAQREMYEWWIASGEVTHEAVLRVVLDGMECFNTRNWSGWDALVGAAEQEDHRGISGVGSDFAGSARALAELLPDAGIALAETIAVDAHGIVNLVSVRGSTPEGGYVEAAMIQLTVLADGRIIRIITYDPDDREAALARFEELRPVARVGPRPNAASRSCEHLLAAFLAGSDRDIVLAPDFQFEDRRAGLGDARGGAAMTEMWAAVREVGVREGEQQLLATAGDRWSMHKQRVAGSLYSAELIALCEVSPDGPVRALLAFDSDDINGAMREMYERWIASGEVEHPDVVRFVLGFLEDVNNRRWDRLNEALSSIVVSGHRHLGVMDFDPGAYANMLREVPDLIPDYRVWPAEIVVTDRDGMLALVRLSGTTVDDTEVDYSVLYLITVEGDRATGLEMFDPEDRVLALARFTELRPTAGTGVAPNEASRVMQQFATAWTARDEVSVTAVLADDIRYDDRRRGVHLAGVERAELLEHLRIIRDLSKSQVLDSRPLATFGEGVAIVAHTLRGPDQDGFMVELLMVVDARDGQVHAVTLFDPDDVNAALRQAIARWIASGEVDHEATLRTSIEMIIALNERDWRRVDELAGAVEVVDHSRGGGLFRATDYLSAMKAMTKQVPDAIIWPTSALALDAHGTLHEIVVRGISVDEGIDAEWNRVLLVTVDGAGVTGVELFEPEDRDAALARFEELRRAGIDNRAARMFQRVARACQQSSWDEVAALLAPTFRAEQRQRSPLVKRRTGADGFLTGIRGAAAAGFSRVDVNVVAVRGDDLALVAVSVVVDAHEGSAALEYLTVVHVDTEDRYDLDVQFDPHDEEAALAELDARHRASGGTDSPPRDNLCTATAEQLMDRFNDTTASVVDLCAEDMEWLDHRPIAQMVVHGREESAVMVEAIARVGGTRVRHTVWATLGSRLALMEITVANAQDGGFEVDALCIIEVAASGLVSRAVFFEPEQLDDALRELFDRWVALEA